MKIKIKKEYGEYQVVVADSKINKMYDRTNEKPIVLAAISGTEGFWCLKDLRLIPKADGYSRFTPNTIQHYQCQNNEEIKELKNTLQYYENKGNSFIWSSFLGVVFPGDKVSQISNHMLAPKTFEYSWSFRKAKEQLNEIAQFWDNYPEDNLDNIPTIKNPHEQINDMLLFFQFSNKNIQKIKHTPTKKKLK